MILKRRIRRNRIKWYGSTVDIAIAPLVLILKNKIKIINWIALYGQACPALSKGHIIWPIPNRRKRKSMREGNLLIVQKRSNLKLNRVNKYLHIAWQLSLTKRKGAKIIVKVHAGI